jgi:hypothetical protein
MIDKNYLVCEKCESKNMKQKVYIETSILSVNGMDYLLTWNCKHIANAVMRPMVEQVYRNHGFEPPTICTPQELMEGQ